MSDVDLPVDFILIVAPCPVGANVVEGWMGRIRAVDAIFGDRPRIYVDPYTRPAEGPAAPRRHGELVTEYRLDPLDETHAALLETLILRARFVYVHTMHLGRYLLPYYPTGKIVTDVHGIVPEEERMLGSPANGDFYEGVERVIMMHSRVMVVVTEAMKDHLLAKHPDCPSEFIVLPIAELAATTAFERRKRHEGERCRALYAGGTQVWQNIGLMLETAEKAAAFCDFEFLSHQHETIRSLAAGTSVEKNALFTVCGKDELLEHYVNADFGFVLRDDTAVNRVSCPTKLSEYLWFGLIPIVKTAAIGDFVKYGYAYLTYEGFARGAIPDAAALEEMRARNRQAIHEMTARFEDSAKKLQSLSLTNRLPNNGLAGLPIGARHLIFPTTAELYLFGEGMHFYSQPAIDRYDSIEWTPELEAPVRILRFIPLIADLTVELLEVYIVVADANDVAPAGCTTPGFAKDDGVYIRKAAPLFDLALSTGARIERVTVRWRMGRLGPREVLSALPKAPPVPWWMRKFLPPAPTPAAPSRTLRVVIEDAKSGQKTEHSTPIACLEAP
jgi:hypothetical protein